MDVFGEDCDLKLTAENIAWLKGYVTAVTETFASEFEAAGDRFKDGRVLLDRFNGAIESVLKNGRSHFRAVDEAHNELCIASAILGNTRLKFNRLEYEPSLSGCARTIDFRATADDGLTVYIDVKTIKPQSTDRWEQFEKARTEGWFPENVHVGLFEEWLGGEIWHAWFAARSRMLEYALELEKKIAEGILASENTAFVLTLCGDGVNWHQSQLEDFVSFYKSGAHRADDQFSQAEQNYMSEKKISLSKTISRFAYMQRRQGQIRQNRFNCHVRPPRNDPFS